MKNSFNTSIDIFILIVKIKVLIFSKFRKNLEKFLEKHYLSNIYAEDFCHSQRK